VGLGLGGSTGGTSSSSTANSNTTPTYSQGQSQVQGLLSSLMTTLLPSVGNGSMSPNVAATTTANADQINQNYSAMGDRMNKFLAARGFGQSGTTGTTALKTELGRQSAQGANLAAGAGNQLGLDSTYLSDALQLAFANPGNTANGSTSGTGSQWGVSAGAGIKIPGLGG
jgi:hypothetical protein